MTQYWPFSSLIRHGALRERLIVSLDLGTPVEALRLVDELARVVGMFKVGKPLYLDCGPDFVREIRRRGGEVFLDLKFHDSAPPPASPPSRRPAWASACSTFIPTAASR